MVFIPIVPSLYTHTLGRHTHTQVTCSPYFTGVIMVFIPIAHTHTRTHAHTHTRTHAHTHTNAHVQVGILIFFENQLTVLAVNRPVHKLQKEIGYHFDLLIVAILAGVCGLLGMPWLCAASVRSIQHLQVTIMQLCYSGTPLIRTPEIRTAEPL